MDALTDVLRTLRLRGTVYFQADFCAPWGMNIKGGEVANFHIVSKGQCWLRVHGTGETLSLHEGDLVVFPHGDSHDLLHAEQADAVPAGALLSKSRSSGGSLVYGGEGPATNLICGHFEYDRAAAHPLFGFLPVLMHIPNSEGQDANWLTLATQLTVLESNAGREGAGAVVDRLAEVLLIQVLRAYMSQLEAREGFLGALSDQGLARVLALIHDQPERGWTVAGMARHAGMSRSTFAARFKGSLGQTPMQYLSQWRMIKAREILQTTDMTTIEVAESIGYQSEFAFAKMFKRYFGMGPGAMRKAAKESA